jgi:outer membrane lipoprotein SlyB
MRKVFYVSASLIALGSLAACTTPGTSDAPDVYSSNEINQAQAATVVSILAVLPARVNEDNSANQQTASNVGTVLGAVGGALLGGLAFHGGYGGAALGAAGGGLLGSAAGATQPVSVLVQGVSITYTVGAGTQPMNSVEPVPRGTRDYGYKRPWCYAHSTQRRLPAALDQSLIFVVRIDLKSEVYSHKPTS